MTSRHLSEKAILNIFFCDRSDDDNDISSDDDDVRDPTVYFSDNESNDSYSSGESETREFIS